MMNGRQCSLAIGTPGTGRSPRARSTITNHEHEYSRLLEKTAAAVKDELEWARNNGACGIFMRGLECERPLGSPYFYPLWEMSGDLGGQFRVLNG